MCGVVTASKARDTNLFGAAISACLAHFLNKTPIYPGLALGEVRGKIGERLRQRNSLPIVVRAQAAQAPAVR